MAGRHRPPARARTRSRCRRAWRSACNPTWTPCAAENAAATRSASIPAAPPSRSALMRPQDTLIANELHPEERRCLKAAIGGDRRAKVMALDAWVALKSLLPPKERRGVVLIDPPFEESGRVRPHGRRAGAGACSGSPPASIIAWYPIKDLKPVARFHAASGCARDPKLPARRAHDSSAPATPTASTAAASSSPIRPTRWRASSAPCFPSSAAGWHPRGGAGYRLDWIESPCTGAGRTAAGGEAAYAHQSRKHASANLPCAAPGNHRYSAAVRAAHRPGGNC